MYGLARIGVHLLMVLFLSIQPASAGGDDKRVKLLSQKEAREVAVDAFKKSGAPFADKFTIKPSENVEKESWNFFVRGVGERMRPGYHAIIRVNKATGAVEIMQGD